MMLNIFNMEMILTGDFNYDLLSKSPSGDCKRLKDLFKNMGLLQFIKEPTRITSTTSTFLDLFLCSHPHNGDL